MVCVRLQWALVAVSPFLILARAEASTATGHLAVSMTIVSTCTVGSSAAMAFGGAGLLTTAVTATGTFTVTCQNATPFSLGLDQGANGGSVTNRRMRGAATGALINYSLYQDAARSVNWGNTAGFWESATGTGSAQTLTVYGLTPAQATPAPDSYVDSVTVTVNY